MGILPGQSNRPKPNIEKCPTAHTKKDQKWAFLLGRQGSPNSMMTNLIRTGTIFFAERCKTEKSFAQVACACRSPPSCAPKAPPKCTFCGLVPAILRCLSLNYTSLKLLHAHQAHGCTRVDLFLQKRLAQLPKRMKRRSWRRRSKTWDKATRRLCLFVGYS
jgi:hypothetical protein